MSKLGFVLPGAVAALAFGTLAVTTVVAQQNSPGQSAPSSSPPPTESERAQPRRDDDFDRGYRWREEDRERRDGRGWEYDSLRRGDGFGRRDFGWRDGDGESRMHREFRGPMMGRPMMMHRRGMNRFCGPDGERWMGAMLERLERVTGPTQAQRPAFDRVKEAAAKAHDTIRAACPSEPAPITPTGRLAAAEKRLEAMLAAVRLVRPPLEEYYGSLSEEQKARFYVSGPRRWREDGDHDRWRRDRGEERRGWREEDRPRWRGEDAPRWDQDRRERRGDSLDERHERRGTGRRGGDRDGDGWADDWRGRS